MRVAGNVKGCQSLVPYVSDEDSSLDGGIAEVGVDEGRPLRPPPKVRADCCILRAISTHRRRHSNIHVCIRAHAHATTRRHRHKDRHRDRDRHKPHRHIYTATSRSRGRHIQANHAPFWPRACGPNERAT